MVQNYTINATCTSLDSNFCYAPVYGTYNFQVVAGARCRVAKPEPVIILSLFFWFFSQAPFCLMQKCSDTSAAIEIGSPISILNKLLPIFSGGSGKMGLDKNAILAISVGFLVLAIAFFAWVMLLPPAPLTQVNNQRPETGIVGVQVAESPSLSQEHRTIPTSFEGEAIVPSEQK